MSGDTAAPLNPKRNMFGRLVAGLSAVGTGWIFFLMAMICADVFSRNAFNAPIMGIAEMVQFSIVGIVFLQLPQTVRSGGLTRSDVLLSGIVRRWPRGAHVMLGLFDLVGAALFAIIFATTVPLLETAYLNNEFYGATGAVQIPTWPLKLLILVGCAALAMQFLLDAWKAAKVAAGRIAPVPIQGAPD